MTASRASQHLLEELRRAGYRVTRPRAHIVEVLVNARTPLSPQEVYERVRAVTPRVGLVTVYRTLEALTRLGLVQRVHQEGRCQAYAFVGRGHRHLAICRRCGTALVVEGEKDTQALEDRLLREQGFLVDGHLLQFWGLCATCRQPVTVTEETR